jgi:hypothetical protein
VRLLWVARDGRRRTDPDSHQVVRLDPPVVRVLSSRAQPPPITTTHDMRGAVWIQVQVGREQGSQHR